MSQERKRKRTIDRTKRQSKKQLSLLSYPGVFLFLLWLLTTFLQAEIEIFLIVGVLCLSFTLVSRIILFSSRREEIEIGGGIFRFLLAWLLAQFFYENLSEKTKVFEWELKAEDVMIGFLLILFVGWFLITGKSQSQELVLGLSPFWSSILLNLWKIAVILELFTLFEELEFLKPYATLLFLIVGFFDLILLLTQRARIDYTDLILNPLQLILAMIEGFLQAIKWLLLIGVFVVLDRLNLDLGTWMLILFAVGVAFITLSESIFRTTLASGIIESRVEEGKAIIPRIFEEIHQFEGQDFQIFEVQNPIELRKKESITKLSPKTQLLRLPFSSDLERLSGIFLTQIELKRGSEDSVKPALFVSSHTHKGAQSLTLRSRGIHRVEKAEWDRIRPSLTLRDKNQIAAELGLEDSRPIDEFFQHSVRTTILAQEHVQNRIRGVPAPTGARPFVAAIQNETLPLPKELLTDRGIQEGAEIEIIPGKGEYLFYGRIRKK